MSEGASEAIAEFCKEKGGSSLRVAFHYENGEYETLYARDDVVKQYSAAELERYFRSVSEGEGLESEQTDSLEVGSHHATLRMYDEALVFHFPQGDSVGTVISFDPEVGRECAMFVVRCLDVLDSGSDQEIPNTPEWDWL